MGIALGAGLSATALTVSVLFAFPALPEVDDTTSPLAYDCEDTHKSDSFGRFAHHLELSHNARLESLDGLNECDVDALRCPFSVSVESPCHTWPLSVSVVLRDSGGGLSYEVSARLADGLGHPLPSELYPALQVLPCRSGSLQDSFVVAPTSAIRLFFDPKSSLDLPGMRDVYLHLECTYDVEHMKDEYRVKLPIVELSSVYHSGFTLDRDAYRFDNVDSCFGMAASAALVFTGDMSLPDGIACVFDADRKDVCPDILRLQESFQNRLSSLLLLKDDDLLTEDEFEWLRNELAVGRPVLVFVARSRLDRPHVVLARGIASEAGGRIVSIAIYDPDESFHAPAGFHADAFALMDYDVVSGRVRYRDYCRFSLLSPG